MGCPYSDYVGAGLVPTQKLSAWKWIQFVKTSLPSPLTSISLLCHNLENLSDSTVVYRSFLKRPVNRPAGVITNTIAPRHYDKSIWIAERCVEFGK